MCEVTDRCALCVGVIYECPFGFRGAQIGVLEIINLT